MINAHTLEKSLSGFSRFLRRNGLPVAVSETVDAVGAVLAVEPASLGALRETLACCLVKNADHITRFNELFDKYFLREDMQDTAVLATLALNRDVSPGDISGSTGYRMGGTAPQGPDGDPALQGWRKDLVLSGDIPDSFRLFLEGRQRDAALRLIKQPLTVSARKSLQRTVFQAALRGIIRKEDMEDVLDTLKNFAEMAKEVEKLVAHRHRPEPVFGPNAVTRSPAVIGECPPDLLDANIGTRREEMRRVLDMIARQIYTGMARQLGTSNYKKAVDYKATIRQSLRTLGEPFSVVRRARKKRLRRLVTICDVSGSVKYATELLFCFMYELHRAFEGRARHYVFVSAVDDVTAYFDEPDFDRCLAGISRAGIDFRGYSDYGAMFRMFAEEYASHVDSDTVVLVLGDARNNRRADSRDVLAGLNSRARAVIWLNPEDPAKWDCGDSIVGVYRRCVSRVVDISTFGKLLGFLTDLPKLVLAG